MNEAGSANRPAGGKRRRLRVHPPPLLATTATHLHDHVAQLVRHQGSCVAIAAVHVVVHQLDPVAGMHARRADGGVGLPSHTHGTVRAQHVRAGACRQAWGCGRLQRRLNAQCCIPGSRFAEGLERVLVQVADSNAGGQLHGRECSAQHALCWGRPSNCRRNRARARCQRDPRREQMMVHVCNAVRSAGILNRRRGGAVLWRADDPVNNRDTARRCLRIRKRKPDQR